MRGERAVPDEFAPFVDHVEARLAEDPRLWARTLLEELKPLDFTMSYQA